MNFAEKRSLNKQDRKGAFQVKDEVLDITLTEEEINELLREFRELLTEEQLEEWVCDSKIGIKNSRKKEVK